MSPAATRRGLQYRGNAAIALARTTDEPARCMPVDSMAPAPPPLAPDQQLSAPRPIDVALPGDRPIFTVSAPPARALALEVPHFVMERTMLREIKRRAERGR